MPHYTQYEGIRYDDPHLQAEFQRLVEEVAAAEHTRAPIQQRHRQAEQEREAGDMSDSQFRAVDDQFISANNKIAAAKRKVEEFLGRHKHYHTT